MATAWPSIKFKLHIKRAKYLEEQHEGNSPQQSFDIVEYKRNLARAIQLAQEFLPKLQQAPYRNLLRFKADIRRKRAEPRIFTPQSAGEAYAILVAEGKRANCELFPISGTLLGLVREGDFLKHDYDLDFGILDTCDPECCRSLIANLKSNPAIKLVETTFASKAMKLLNREFRSLSSLPLKIKIIFSNGIAADIMTHFNYNSHLYHGSAKNL